MKYQYKFSNLLGTVYHKGNVEFLNDGNTVVSPVGNRISLFDLKSNKSETLPISLHNNIACLAIAPNGLTIIAIDEEGEASLISLKSKSILYRHHFRKPISSIKFSPDGKKFAILKENSVLVYHAPGSTKEINPFILYRTYYGAYNEITCIDWTSDSRAFAIGGKDMNTRIYAAVKLENLVVYSIGGHKDEIMGCFFEPDSLDFYSISRDGALNVWECDTDLADLRPAPVQQVIPYSESSATETNEQQTAESEAEVARTEENKSKILYKRVSKHFYNKEGDFNNVTCVSYHKSSHILVTGFASGAFYLHELPDFNVIHSLSITDHPVTATAFNSSGDWLALGASSLGQLIVWEWQSESYIMKQQGHYNAMTSLDYSPDGQYIVTGGEDGKVKAWNADSGFCFVTFKDHVACVTSVLFVSSGAGHVIMSASLDGTVRAFDLKRYRNFRTFASPRPAQFVCLATDSSGELVCAGSRDSFEIFVWSLRTGRLLDVLAGHEGPVVDLSFSPTSSILASASWDKSAILWTVGSSEKSTRESLPLGHDVLAVAFRPDGKEVAVATLNAELTFWDVNTATQRASIDCRFDVRGGRGELDRVAAKTSSFGKAFETIAYSADGEVVLVGGQSKFICLYHVKQQMLMKKFEVSINLSFDCMQEMLDKRKMTEFGPSAAIDMDEEAGVRLPGVRTSDKSSRSFAPEIRVAGVRFSPTGREWAAVTTEGLLIFSLDSHLVFDPFQLDCDVTPANIRTKLAAKDYVTAVAMSFRLNQKPLTVEIVEQIPLAEIEMVSKQLPLVYVEKLLEFVADRVDKSTHAHFYLMWSRHLLLRHGAALKKRGGKVAPTLTHLQKALTRKHRDLAKQYDFNFYQIEYILNMAELRKRRAKTDDRQPLPPHDDDAMMTSSWIDDDDVAMT